jgi:membrane-associated phospholipid phosphatase
VGIAVILVAIAVLDPRNRRAIPRVAAASLGAGLAANVLKLLVARARPHHFDLSGDALDSFAGWFPMLANASAEQGFPSSHAATAAGLAIALAWLYPRGRWLFPAMAALAGFQRVLAESHFLSDVLWGSAVGCIFAPLCVYGSRLARKFDRLEKWLTDRPASISLPAGPHRRVSTPALPGAPSGDVPHAA